MPIFWTNFPESLLVVRSRSIPKFRNKTKSLRFGETALPRPISWRYSKDESGWSSRLLKDRQSTHVHRRRALARGRSTPELIAEIDHAIESTYRDVIAKEFPAMPGAIELVRSLHDAGFKIAVGSSAPRENVDASIRGLGIEPLLSAVVCQNVVKEVKPNPAIFLQAAKQMGILPENCIVIEDSTFGIAAAKAAGMYCIGFQSKGHYLEKYGQADRVIHSLTELDPASILAISRSRNIMVQKYFVCLIDVLGQQDRLRSWAKMPENGQVTPQYLEAVKKSAGTVVQLNIGFQEFFKKFIQKDFIHGEISSDEHKKENLDMYCEFIKFREREYSQTVSTQQFSDTLIFYAPLVMRGTKQFSLLPPIAMICACAWTMLDALQAGIPFRGGLALDADDLRKPTISKADQEI